MTRFIQKVWSKDSRQINTYPDMTQAGLEMHVPHLVVLITIEPILVQTHVERIVTQQPVLGPHIQNHW